ncbi:protein FAR1-RELATED SEQUENCE 4-like [Magnolia sinica]|uniref:protein FAR1-RELATED SEQUENCE 4-like n=1 Tax=Magnolia sinica TaxID=86752 RepID=UPI0026589719|nr:protein FAR1-RELATED SEQUENCE 4-like [Magnolia sinica]
MQPLIGASAIDPSNNNSNNNNVTTTDFIQQLAFAKRIFYSSDETEENYAMGEQLAIEHVEPPAIVNENAIVEIPPATVLAVNDEDLNLEPSVGMEFGSEEAVYQFYNQYARRIGFGITRLSIRRSRTNRSKIAGHYACTKHGLKSKRRKTENPQPPPVAGCKAMIKAKKKGFAKWVLTEVLTGHNHELRPGEPEFFRSHREPGKPLKSASKSSRGSGMRRNRYAADGGDGLSIMGADERRKHLAGGDAEAILVHFTRMNAVNPAFFYAVEVDGAQHMGNVLWADARSKTAYTYFGDVVTFDTTYVTHKYNVPVAPFVGVNHHGQLVLLGCALIANETKESYVWLFRTWLEAMSGQPPKAIITNEDKAIKAAIMEVFPETRHRLCLWHILEKVPEKLDQVCRANPAFTDRLHDCVYDSLTIDEFEMKWSELIKDFNLGEHPWLQTLYEDKQLWVPVFLKDVFFAGMSTSQRGERVNPFFDKYVNVRTTLKEFIDRYESTIESWYEKEAKEDFETFHKTPSLSTPSPFERQAAAVYTREIFKRFQAEVLGMSASYANIVQQQGTLITYVVKEWEDFEKLKGKEYKVLWNAYEVSISCICRLFEFRGFLCRHALVVLMASGVPTIPSQYILKRWTKEMRNRHVMDDCHIEPTFGVHHPKSMRERYNDICQRFMQFAQQGSLSEEMYNTASQELQKAMKQLAITKKSIGMVRNAPPRINPRPSIPTNQYGHQDSETNTWRFGLGLTDRR